jgi:predicted RNA-binding Zn-ribbon protein involved in translation (DUF1610 family)
MIKFSCKSCGQKLNVDDKHSGKGVKCPKCGEVVVVPANSDKITFHCESCGQKINVPKIHAGKKGKCPKCQNIVVVPDAEAIPKALSGTGNSVQQQIEEPSSGIQRIRQNQKKVKLRLIFIISGSILVLFLVIGFLSSEYKFIFMGVSLTLLIFVGMGFAIVWFYRFYSNHAKRGIEDIYNCFQPCSAIFNVAVHVKYHTYMERGVAYHQKGDYEHAIYDFNEAILIEPKNADVYMDRGFSLYSTCPRPVRTIFRSESDLYGKWRI